MLSLEKNVDVGLIACTELAPALWSLADSFPEALAELVTAARAQSPKQSQASAQS